MLLNGMIVGSSVINNAGTTPALATYDTVTVYGNAIVDKVRVLSNTLTQAQMDNIRPPDIFSWTPETLMYAEFSNNLSAGNITGITNPITSWLVFRRKATDQVFTQIATLDVGVNSWTDFEAKTNNDYIYRVYGQSTSELSNPLTADIIKTDWYYWSLTDTDSGKVYLFDLDLQSGSQTTSSSMEVYDTAYTEHPSVSFSKNKFTRGAITAFAGVIKRDGTNELQYPIEYLDDLESFIHNGKEKILKDRRGRGWRVGTDNFKVSYKDKSYQQFAEISFDYVETGNLNS